MKKGVRFFVFILILIMQTSVSGNFTPAVQPRGYILMDYDTGTIIAESNSNTPYPIASVTKVMTMLICMEALQSGKISMEDSVFASEYACSMGGSQIYLEPGEEMTVSELLKSVAVASANDASVVLAEHIMGSEASFVDAMNKRAKALGMKNTNFENCNGLDQPNHYSSAADVAIMSAELLKHDEIRPFLGIWMDSVRNGKFGLSNTNKLIRFYDGAIGIKTGSTSGAKYCLSAAAQRDGMTLISVVIGADTSSQRFETAKELLNYGFANYKTEVIVAGETKMEPVPVLKGKKDCVETITDSACKILAKKQGDPEIKLNTIINQNVKAPVFKGDVLGKIEIFKQNKPLCTVNIIAAEDVKRLDFTDVLRDLIKKWTFK